MAIINFIELQGSDFRLLFSIGVALFSALIGGGITIWYKKKEIKSLSDTLRLQTENLTLQKLVFEEVSKNNELKIKAELVRLEDLNRQYKLNLQKHNFDHLSKILDLGDSKNEKILMLKEMANILKKYAPKIPEWIVDNYEYQEFLISHVYSNLDYIRTGCQNIVSKFPNVFIELHQDFNNVSGNVSYIKSQATDFFMLHTEVTEDIVIQDLSESLLGVHDDFYAILEKMKEEFRELESMKRKYVRAQFKLKEE
jgi:hypothetical protein